MAKYLFVVPPFTGHINPTLSLGQELTARGHEVAWVCLKDNFKDQIPENGQLFCAVEDFDADLLDKETEQEVQDKAQKAHGLHSIQMVLEEVIVPLSKIMFEGIQKAIADWKPDLIVTDAQLVAGAVAAHKAGIPYITSITAPTTLLPGGMPKIVEWARENILATQRELGLDIEETIDNSPLLNLVYTSKEFLANTELPENFQYVGPLIAHRSNDMAFDWEKFHDTPTPRILVSIGTTFDTLQQQSFFSRMVEALAEQPITAVLVADPGLFEAWPSNFMVQPRVPQMALLDHVDAVVSHGGHNTVCESIFKGVPLVTTPIAYDQAQVASMVTEAGCGLRLVFKRFKAKNMLDAITKLLEDPAYKEAAKQMGDSFKKAGGTKRAVDLIEEKTPSDALAT